jgi:hypothetical protein
MHATTGTGPGNGKQKEGGHGGGHDSVCVPIDTRSSQSASPTTHHTVGLRALTLRTYSTG